MANPDLPPSEARRLLAAHVASGKQLILSSSFVGDPDDFDVWTWKCKDWSARLRDALRFVYGDEAARTFEAALLATARSGAWQDAFHAELERLQQAIEMLTDLATESVDNRDSLRIGGTDSPSD